MTIYWQNYQKPIDEDKKRCQDLLIDSRLMRVFVEKMHQLKSIPRHVVDVDSIESVAKEAVYVTDFSHVDSNLLKRSATR